MHRQPGWAQQERYSHPVLASFAPLLLSRDSHLTPGKHSWFTAPEGTYCEYCFRWEDSDDSWMSDFDTNEFYPVRPKRERPSPASSLSVYHFEQLTITITGIEPKGGCADTSGTASGLAREEAKEGATGETPGTTSSREAGDGDTRLGGLGDAPASVTNAKKTASRK